MEAAEENMGTVAECCTKETKISMQEQMDERKKKMKKTLKPISFQPRSSRATSPNILFRNRPSSLNRFMKEEKLAPLDENKCADSLMAFTSTFGRNQNCTCDDCKETDSVLFQGRRSSLNDFMDKENIHPLDTNKTLEPLITFTLSPRCVSENSTMKRKQDNDSKSLDTKKKKDL